MYDKQNMGSLIKKEIAVFIFEMYVEK